MLTFELEGSCAPQRLSVATRIRLLAGLIVLTATASAQVGHSHNDYLREAPLIEALAAGMQSVEADVHLIAGELLVAHTRAEIRATESLESLYLLPLAHHFAARDHYEQGLNRPLVLLIDIKSEALETWQAVEAQLARRAPLFERFLDGRVFKGPVRAVISGNRPLDAIAGARRRHSSIDGRLGDLETRAPNHLLPLISTSWRQIVPPRMNPPAVDDALHTLGAKAKHRLFRIWGSPDDRRSWARQKAAGLSMINTDQPRALATFLSLAGP